MFCSCMDFMFVDLLGNLGCKELNINFVQQIPKGQLCIKQLLHHWWNQ